MKSKRLKLHAKIRTHILTYDNIFLYRTIILQEEHSRLTNRKGFLMVVYENFLAVLLTENSD